MGSRPRSTSHAADRGRLFIDGINTHYKPLADGIPEPRHFGARVLLVVIEDQKFSPLRPLLDWLCYNRFTVVTKRAKEFDDGEGRPGSSAAWVSNSQ
jgi:hypothetical protein